MKTFFSLLLLVFGVAYTSAEEVHRWTFNDGINDSVGSADLTLNGDATVSDGQLVLDGDGDFAITTFPLSGDLTERTLVAWVSSGNISQAGSGVITTVRTTSGVDTFDGIVYGERATRQWMNGSNSFVRSVTDNGGPPEDSLTEVMIAITYGPGNEITIYKNGQLYSLSGATQGTRIDYLANSTFIHLGERHNTTNVNRFFEGSINEARIYDSALGASEIAAIYAAGTTPEPGTPLTGRILVTQNSLDNTPEGITLSLAPVSSPGTTFNIPSSNRGDYAIDLPFTNDITAGALIVSSANISRNNSIAPNAGGPNEEQWPYASTDIIAAQNNYFIAVHSAPDGAEMNADVTFAHFPYDAWTAAVTTNPSNGAAISIAAASSGITLGTHIIDQGTGVFPVDLTSLGASSQEGVLLAVGARNDDNATVVESEADGTFTIRNRDITENSAVTERDPISFVFIPQADVGTKGLVTMGRVNADASTDISGGGFTITQAETGFWELSIPGHSQDTGILLVSAEGVPGPGTADNIVLAEWDDTRGAWLIGSFDTPPASTSPMVPQGFSNGSLDVFSFAFFSSRPPLLEESTSTTPILTKNAIARQSSVFPVNLPDRTDGGVAIDFGRIPASSNRTATARTDTAPWLEVELERDALIESVEILNFDFALSSTCCRSRLRDIKIEIYDNSSSSRQLLAESPLLNPENTGFTFPDGPRAISHRFNLTQPARLIRISRIADPDLSGTNGQGSPALDEQYLLEVREVLVRGQFSGDQAIKPISIVYDSRKAFPDPLAQGYFSNQIVEGSDQAPRDGTIDSGANAGYVYDDTEAEVVWQVNDNSSSQVAFYNSKLSSEHLEAFFRLGWEFEIEVKAISGTGNIAGAVGWGCTDSANPGWDFGTNTGMRVLFDIGRNSDGNFTARPTNGSTTVFGSANDYYTIRAVGAPGSTIYEWFIDGVSQGTIDARSNVAGLTKELIGFGSGATSQLRKANWKRVSLSTPPITPRIASDDLIFHLPFEPGNDGSQTFRERSQPPASKPRIILNTTSTQTVRRIPNGAVQNAVRVEEGQIDAKTALPLLAGLTEGTLSFWLRTEIAGGEFFSFERTIDPVTDAITQTTLFEITDAPVTLTYQSEEGGTIRSLSAVTPDLTNGDWHHIAVSISSGETRLYLDGQMITNSTTSPPVFPGSLNFLDQFSLAESSNADIDEAMIWDQALTDADVSALYQHSFYGSPQTFDQDQDGLNELEEMRLGTSDTNIDSDGDTLSDADELILGTDPSKKDSDNDGVNDDEEVVAGSNPAEADSDGDGFTDLQEQTAGTSTNDPTSFPPLAPALDIDRDGDGFSEYAEVLFGTDPGNEFSFPGSGGSAAFIVANGTAGSNEFATLFPINFLFLANGDVTFDFKAEGDFTNLRIQSSATIGGFTNFPSAVITSTGTDLYSSTFTPPAGHRFFRAAADTDGGVITTRSADFTLPDEELALVRTEGDTVTLPLTFGSSFTGTINYEISGIDPGGELLPTTQGSLFVSGGQSANINLPLYDDLTVGPSARYTITLLNSPGIIAGLAASVTIVVEDNDCLWQGTLRVAEENLDFTLEVLKNDTTEIIRLNAPSEASFFPQGSFAVDASFGESAFTATAGNIILNRIGSELVSEPGSVTAFFLKATDGVSEQIVNDDLIKGLLDITLTPANDGSPAERSGTFNLLKQPPPPPENLLNLEDTPASSQ